MKPAEGKFKLAVLTIAARGEYPSPGRIERELGHPVRHNLNGRECRWREEILKFLGWRYVGGYVDGKRPRQSWVAP